MKLLLTSLSLFMLWGCATSTPEKKKDKSVEEISNKDFNRNKLVRYQKSDDYFQGVQSKHSGALNDESLERVINYEGDIETKNIISKIAKKCYEKKFNDAFIMIRNISKDYSKNAIFWNQVGTCYLLKNERRKALLFFNKSLDLKRDYVPALNNLGVMYFRERDYDRALVAFQKAIKKSEFTKTPRFNIANLYLQFGLADQSLQYSKPLHSVNSKDVDVLYMLGTAYLMKNMAKRATAYFSGIDEDYLERASFGLNYSLALLSNGQREKAVDVFEDIDKKTIGPLSPYYQKVKKALGVKND